MEFKKGRYSGFIRPILYVLDVQFLVLFVLFFHPIRINSYKFLPFLVIGWFLGSFFTDYYKVYRFTRPIKMFNIALRQYGLFSLLYFSYFSFGPTTLRIPEVFYGLLVFFSTCILLKYITYKLLIRYRLKGGNRRNAIVVGISDATKNITESFLKNPIYGYNFLGFFSDKNTTHKLGDISQISDFVLTNNIDEIYCSVNELSEQQLNDLIKFANVNFKSLKFIPDSKQILASNFEVDYYEYFPVLSMNELALNKPLNQLMKRTFDFIFSLIVILGVLSWLTPLLFILIKLESGGNLFYVQDRNGIYYKPFKCYKFTSLRSDDDDVLHVAKDDNRVTKVGAFIRKTSIDELPQFINVLKGEMSVVGPRPHMLAYNKSYAEQVDNTYLMARHKVLPGITGLAQVSGYRGEVKTDADINGRVKLDIFYINNWSVLMDVKIIFSTVFKFLVGDKKAY